jgi:protein disulfide-isomerase
MKHFLITVTSMLALAVASFAGETAWLDNFEAAKKQAAEENKPILINFTGTDWCGWCIKLEKEVFSKEEFLKYAKENLILMEVDFPRKKKQAENLTVQNKALDKEFKIEGYPTVFLIDSKGKKLSEDIGYREGGAQAYVDHLKSLLKK